MVDISSPAFTCRPPHQSGTTYGIDLAQVGRGPLLRLASGVRVGAYGAFRTVVRIPADASRGQSFIIVHGSRFDDCGRLRGTSCAGYAVALDVT